MHLVLTDVLICPRCGPGHGLIVLAERIEARRVLEGRLGCPSCQEHYPVVGGFADLRVDAGAGGAEAALEAGEAAAPGAAGEMAEEAFRLAALMGAAEGRGFSLIAGPLARLAPGVAAAVEGLEVVALEPALAAWPEQQGVNRLAADRGLPFAERSLRAVALSGAAAGTWLEEGVRVLSPVGRLVLVGPPAQREARLRAAGMARVMREGDTIVAARY